MQHVSVFTTDISQLVTASNYWVRVVHKNWNIHAFHR